MTLPRFDIFPAGDAGWFCRLDLPSGGTMLGIGFAWQPSLFDAYGEVARVVRSFPQNFPRGYAVTVLQPAAGPPRH